MCSRLKVALGVVVTSAMIAGAANRAVLAQSTPRREPTFVLRGQVRAAGEGPLAMATVRLFHSDSAVRTNADGEFILSGLPHGLRIFEITAVGFKPQMVTVVMSDTTAPVAVTLMRGAVVLDSVRVTSTAPMPRTPPGLASAEVSRRRDRISEQELSYPDVIGGNALDAFALLRPNLFLGRPFGGSVSEAAEKGQMYLREKNSRTGKSYCTGNRVCDIDVTLSVSINEGAPGSPDVLTTIGVRVIREMRYLPPSEATARFGVNAGNGPVLVVYTK